VAGVGVALALATLTEDAAAAAAAKSGWRWCLKCRGLFAGQGTKSVGVCAAGGAHKPWTGDSYVLLSDLDYTNADLIKNWFQCQKCRGLYADDLGESGVCAKSGAHKRTGPQNALWKGAAASMPFMEAGWDECVKCSGLVWVNSANGFGVCPAGGVHQRNADDYKIIRIG
jgi:hypothetical protein